MAIEKVKLMSVAYQEHMQEKWQLTSLPRFDTSRKNGHAPNVGASGSHTRQCSTATIKGERAHIRIQFSEVEDDVKTHTMNVEEF